VHAAGIAFGVRLKVRIRDALAYLRRHVWFWVLMLGGIVSFLVVRGEAARPEYFLSTIPQTLGALFGIVFAVGAVVVGGPPLRAHGLVSFVFGYPPVAGALGVFVTTLAMFFWRLYSAAAAPCDAQLLTLSLTTLACGLLAGTNLVQFSSPEKVAERLASSVTLNSVMSRPMALVLGGLDEDPHDPLVLAVNVLSDCSAVTTRSFVRRRSTTRGQISTGIQKPNSHSESLELGRRIAVAVSEALLLSVVSWPIDPLLTEEWCCYITHHLTRLATTYHTRVGVSYVLRRAIEGLPDARQRRTVPQPVLGFYAVLLSALLASDRWEQTSPLMGPTYLLLGRSGIEDCTVEFLARSVENRGQLQILCSYHADPGPRIMAPVPDQVFNSFKGFVEENLAGGALVHGVAGRDPIEVEAGNGRQVRESSRLERGKRL
jgi:hypothetical protein